METGSVKEKRVAPALIEERKRLDFDQEELSILLIKTKEANDIRMKCHEIAENDPILRNTP